MLKLILLTILAFGAYMAFAIFFPTSAHTAFQVSGHAIPWIAIGVGVIGYVGWKAIK